MRFRKSVLLGAAFGALLVVLAVSAVGVWRSATVAQLAYTWPVGPKVDATMQAAVGNVFGEHLTDFDPRLLRVSAAFGLEAHVGDPPIQFLVGFGTEPIDRGATVDSFRITVGVPRTF